jgi:hypothetical protein
MPSNGTSEEVEGIEAVAVPGDVSRTGTKQNGALSQNGGGRSSANGNC